MHGDVPRLAQVDPPVRPHHDAYPLDSCALLAVSWNAESKASLDQLEEVHRITWAALALQEVNTIFSIGVHFMKVLPGRRSRRHTALIVHRRLATQIICWGGVESPWAPIRCKGVADESSVAFVC